MSAARYFRLDSADQSLVLACEEAMLPRLLCWGPRLPDGCDLAMLAAGLESPLPHGALDVAERVSWLPEAGRGFTDAPGLQLRRGERLLHTQFVLIEAAQNAGGWRFVCRDEGAALELELSIELDAASGVFTAGCDLGNCGGDALTVDALASLVLPVPAQLDERLALHGRWSDEFHIDRVALGSAAWLQESRVGRTSHHAFPGLMLMQRACTDSLGEAWALHLAWSGNHRLLLQRCRLGGVQLQVGELLLPGEVVLAPGERHRTPRVHLARSDRGLRALSARLHRFVRERVLPKVLSPRPVQFNSWEATYFEHDEVRMRALADAAADVGAERFIVDDGWFVGRRNDRAGLGDWTPCPERYPQGLAPLAAHCRGLGLSFGLWVEPEGVNADSALYRAHPEWVLGVAGLVQPLGRHQYVLNLGLPAVREHLFSALSALLKSTPIEFLKWDMNRDLTHAAGPDGRAAVRAHVLGVYELIDRLRAAFPALEIESCASGGGRADWGMLSRSDRIWVSDCNDPLERQRIQRGFLLFFPPEVMGVHVGDARSHTTGRFSDIAFRGLTALFGHFGIEADLLKMPATDRAALRRLVLLYKAERAWLHRAAVAPIDHPDPAVNAVLARADDGSRALLSVAMLARARDAIPAALRVSGLLPDAIYELQMAPECLPSADAGKARSAFHAGRAIQLPGSALAASGIALPLMPPASGLLIRIERIAAAL